MAGGDFELARDNGIATLTITRPSRRNALHGPLWKGLGDAARSLAANPPRALVVTGAGGHFCAGMDLQLDNPLMARLAPAVHARDPGAVREIILELKSHLQAIADVPCPVIAAIEGACLGGGLELALACDLRVAGESAFFSLPETQIGMVPDVGGTVRLTQLVGRTRAAGLILTGRRISARQAEAWGLLNEVVPDGGARAAAMAMATDVAGCSPTANRMALGVLRAVHGVDPAIAFEAETEAGATAVASGEVLEGLAAFAQRRPPRWG